MIKNNAHMTNDEMADIAESIITGRPLKEDVYTELTKFADKYEDMKEILNSLQGYLMTKAKDARLKKTNLMGDGTVIKALNHSKKLDLEMQRMNKDAAEFITIMRQVIMQ